MVYLDHFCRVKPPEKRRVLVNHWSEKKQPPEPPPAAYKRHLTGKRRQNAVDAAATILNTYTFSAFQHESAVRHGLRTAFCELGRKWAWADFEANEIVQTALNQIGAQRPSWYAGQPEYLVPDENCRNINCGRPLDDEDIAEGRRYCSEWCKAATLQYRYNTHRYIERLTEINAWYHVRKQTVEPRQCALPSCGKVFRSQHKDVQHCSHSCANLARGNNFEVKVCQNPACGQEFVHKNTHNREGLYCSTKCYFDGRAVALPERLCAFPSCGKRFQPTAPTQKFCCIACNKKDHERRKREARPPLYPDRQCDQCGEWFSPKLKTARFCSKPCNIKFYNEKRYRPESAFRCDPA